ncbi:hypothetical protein CXB51_014931 [Gossypium anomalum]|uniref:Aminotransferase-like plant mobile domain-containing protein n=1 Tax=Gossypium anomalum TaxID=47600 RepID=A0A8J5Z659_9ROSI|nr:hypothetical protein CXB51_014931 [Gossypium anomalum]
MGKPAILQIRGYLQQAKFLHVSRMTRGCKLDFTLISALVERWRPETYTFHFSYGECIIKLEDIVLQLGMPMDGPIIMGSVVVLIKVDLYRALLGKVLDKFEGGWISINWRFFGPRYRIRCQSMVAYSYCSHGSGGDNSFYVPRWNHGLSYVGLLKDLEDSKLLLDQCSEADFKWMSYAETDIISCIPPEVLENREMWDAKVSLVVHTTIEIHESDQVLRQFEWRQRISPPLRDLKELHKVDMLGKKDDDWTQRKMSNTYRGSNSPASRIYYRWRREEAKFGARSNDDHPSSSIIGDAPIAGKSGSEWFFFLRSRVEVYVEVSIDDRYVVMDRATGTFNLPFYPNAGTAVDTRGLSNGEWLLWCSKCVTPFGVTMVVFIKQAINNYSRYHAGPSLTSIVLEHPLST